MSLGRDGAAIDYCSLSPLFAGSRRAKLALRGLWSGGLSTSGLGERAPPPPAPVALCAPTSPRKRGEVTEPASAPIQPKPSCTRLSLYRRRTWDAAEQSGLLLPRYIDQPVGGVLDRRLDAGDEILARQACWQGIEEFDHQCAGIAHESPARPEQSGIQRHGNAGHAGAGIDLSDAGHVIRRRT